jgi:cysteinyl-tRNA synthetase
VAGAAGPDAGGPPPGGAGDAPSPLLEAVGRQQAAFGEAVGASDVPAAVRAVLELDRELEGWSWDTLQSDEQDRARSALRSLVVRLGELAGAGAGDPSTVVAPFVEALLELRAAAREEGRWKEADSVRDRLLALGIEVRDTPSGPTWRLAG